MAVCGMPEDHHRCPDCGEMLRYNSASRSYLHVLRNRCPMQSAVGVAALEAQVQAARP